MRTTTTPARPLHAVIEVPRARRQIPDVTTLSRGSAAPTIRIALGVDLAFRDYWVGLADLPPLLVAGMTGSGKSVFVRSLLWQLAHLYAPQEVDLVVVDAKGMRDYSDFRRAPHFKQRSDFHLGTQGALEKLEHIVDALLPERIDRFNSYADEAELCDAPVHLTDLPGVLRDAKDWRVPSPIVPLVVFIDELIELVVSASDRRKFDRLITSLCSVRERSGAIYSPPLGPRRLMS